MHIGQEASPDGQKARLWDKHLARRGGTLGSVDD